MVLRQAVAEYWRAEFYKAKADNVALHKGIRRLKRVEKELRERLSAKEHEASGGPFKC